MSIGSFFQSISAHEITMFIVLVILFILLGLFYHYGIVQMRVQRESRCMKEASLSGKTGVFNVLAKVYNRPAYQVSYDALAKRTKITCACQEGDVESTFTSIPYYDLSSTTPEKDRVRIKDALVCSCETNLSSASNDTSKVSYYGEPGIAKFMYDTKNTGFFDTMLYGPDYEYVSK